jgi:uncharacterized protein (DUF1330 family)
MAYEMLMGLQVTNDEIYTLYREAMAPFLKKYGGGFRYDFKIVEVLKNEEGRPINRVFCIFFADKEKMDQFFADAEYKKVKEQYFDASVKERTTISEYFR